MASFWLTIITFLLLLSQRKSNSILLSLPREEISIFKPIIMNPRSSTCGLEFKENLCDNRYQEKEICSNSSAIISCFQACPYGNTLLNMTVQTDQLNLEQMEPCAILKDFGRILTQSKATHSYLFDSYNDICNNMIAQTTWRVFHLKSISDNFLGNLKSNFNRKIYSTTINQQSNYGLTASLWFQQTANNNKNHLDFM